MCFVYVFALEECARVVAYWRSLLIGPHYRSDKRWHDTQVIRTRHFSAMLRSRLMSIVMIVCVEHEHACVRARASCDGVQLCVASRSLNADRRSLKTRQFSRHR